MAITPLPPAPEPSDTQAQFDTKAFALVAALDQFVTETNATALAVDADAATATAQAGIATTKAGEASGSANAASDSAAAAAISESAAASDAANTAVLLATAGSMLGINFGAFTMVDNELIVTHLSTTTPSIVNGDLILTYETL